MTDKPIIFSTPMILALLDGRKTQTRRILNPQPTLVQYPHASPVISDGRVIFRDCWQNRQDVRLPYAPGDRLWVREGLTRFDRGTCDQWVWYRAGRNRDPYVARHFPDQNPDGEWAAPEGPGGGAPYTVSPIFCPRWASRLTLLVTDVRAQRLQEISEADAIAEGAGLYVPGHGFITESELRADPGYSNFLAPRMGFDAIWSDIHGPDAWNADPWVGALTFTVHRQNIDQMGDARA